MTSTIKVQHQLKSSFEKIQSQTNSWEGILEIKLLEKVDNIDYLLEVLNDNFWLVRWIAVQKLEQLQNPKAIDSLLDMLDDRDETVKYSVNKAIHACIKSDIRPLLKRCCDQNNVVFNFVKKYIERNLLTYYDQIEIFILCDKPIESNFLLLLMFSQLKEKLEPLLLKAAKLKCTQKNAIMMLAIINSRKTIPVFISLFENANLKRHIIQAFLELKDTNKYSNLIEYHKIKEVRPLVEQMIIKLSNNIIPTLINCLETNKYREFILKVIYKIPLEISQIELIEKKVKLNPFLRKQIDISLLKSK